MQAREYNNSPSHTNPSKANQSSNGWTSKFMLLEEYNDSEYIIQGFSNSFKIDFEGPELPLSGHNLIKERELEAYVALYKMHLSKCVVPCQYENNKHLETRLLHSLSYPYDESAINSTYPRKQVM